MNIKISFLLQSIPEKTSEDEFRAQCINQWVRPMPWRLRTSTYSPSRGWVDTSVKWTLPMLGVSACLHLCCSTCMGSFTETGAMLWVRRKQFRRLNLNCRKNEKSSLCASICLRKSNLPFFLPNGTIMRKSVWFDNGHGATNGVAAKKTALVTGEHWADNSKGLLGFWQICISYFLINFLCNFSYNKQFEV